MSKRQPDPPSFQPGEESHEVAASTGLFEEAARLRSEGEELTRRVRRLQADADAYRATERASLNLLEDAVLARDVAKRESAERQRVESELAEELTATRVLQRLSSQLIREEEGHTFYERIVDTAIELVHSDCGSLQLFDPRTQTLRLLAWKGFDPDCDILISDIRLPDGNGHELLRRLNLPRPVYAIAISGFGTKDDIARSKAAGFRQHLVKPFSGADLKSFLDEAVASSVCDLIPYQNKCRSRDLKPTCSVESDPNRDIQSLELGRKVQRTASTPPIEHHPEDIKCFRGLILF